MRGIPREHSLSRWVYLSIPLLGGELHVKLRRMVSIPIVQATVDLNPLKFQTSRNQFLRVLENQSLFPFLHIEVKTPKSDIVELQVRHWDAYVIGFKGTDGWYSFSDHKGGWGPSCGIESNYNALGKVGKVTYDDLQNLGQIAQFKNGQALDRRSIAILILCTSEAVRFSSVSSYVTGLTNSVGTELSPALMRTATFDFEYLRDNYLRHWANPPEVKMEIGVLYHFDSRRGITFPHRGNP